MADPYSNISDLDREKQKKLAHALELRAEDDQMKVITDTYLSDIPFTKKMRVLDIGCGTGAVTRIVASKLADGEIVGLDPSYVFLEKARDLSGTFSNISFEQGDGRQLPFGENSFDVVVFHTVLSHMPSPESFLKEAYRVLKPGGYLSVFDGDYASRTVALGKNDPLQCCIEMMKEDNCYDLWLIRKLPSLVRTTGYDVVQFRSFGYLATHPAYMVNFLERGADVLVDGGYIDKKTAGALKEEAHTRVREQRFFGFIPFASLIACKSVTVNK